MRKRKTHVFRSAFVLLLFLAACPLYAGAEIRISGTVADKQKEPLIGVSILVQGTSIGASFPKREKGLLQQSNYNR